MTDELNCFICKQWMDKDQLVYFEEEGRYICFEDAYKYQTAELITLRSRLSALQTEVEGRGETIRQLREMLFNSYAATHNNNGWHRGDFADCLMSTCVHNRERLAATAPVEGETK